MDFNEFKERTNAEITEEDYRKIETVYLAHPMIRDVSDMVEFWFDYGMKGIEVSYELAKSYEIAKEKGTAICNERNMLQVQVDNLKEKVEALSSLVSKDALAKMLVEKMSIEDLAVLIAKRE